jgi:hypothetical protein
VKREDYELVKRKNPDWDKVIAQDIRSWVKLFTFDSVLAKKDEEAVFKVIYKRIEDFTSLFDDDELRKHNYAVLTEYAVNVYKWTLDAFGAFTPYLLSIALAPQKSLTAKQINIVATQGKFILDMSQANVSSVASAADKGTGYTNATAANEYYGEVHKKVKAKMAEYEELDTKRYYSSNVNMRNIAEMNVRFNAYLENKRALISKGVKLVYVRPHSNCSKRCQPYQGKLYSLDGTSGSQDGRKYIPIEDVSDKVTATSKSTGRQYYCGLFSYNCRHVMEEYKSGMNFEIIPDAVIEKQRNIEARQRKMERDYRALREKAELYDILYNRSGNKEIHAEATKARKAAASLKKKYIAYSRENNVTYYPTRLQILAGEDRYVRTVGKNDPIAQKAFKLKNEA